ncbi:MAG: hypothetical protein A2138_17810 [Deltaproteobacteria bacterium RBG_16_71_12]|nr:MAG: hypothetical protein A2138_17810 [Deltaproteobacteria bacterium RBG_16_71_12]
MMLPVLLLLVPGQAIRAPAGDMAAPMEPPQLRVPAPGDTEVPRNAAFITTEQVSAASIVTFDGATESETSVMVETIEGLTIARLPLQPALANVTLRLTFGGGFTEDTSWTTGNALIDGPAAPAQVARAEVVRPLLENPHVEIALAPDADLAAAVLSAVAGEQRTRLAASISWGGSTPVSFADWSYQGGTRDYDIVAIDRAGNVADATPVTVSEVGCAAAPAGATGLLALALLAVGRRRRAPRMSTATR